MIRFTTPTHVFKTNIDLTQAGVIFITYKQGGNTVVEKTKEDLTIEQDQLSVKLTQEDTGKFVQGNPVEIQIRVRFDDDTAIASNIMKTTVERVLKDGVI